MGPLSKGKTRVFYDLSPDYPVATVVGLGAPDAGVNAQEELNEARENVRAAVASGVRAIRDIGGDWLEEVVVDDCHDPEAAAEGAVLGLYYFDELKSEKYRKKKLKISLLPAAHDKSAQAKWDKGVTVVNGQNLARRLMELPANIMTPTYFAKTVSELAASVGVTAIVRDKAWAESKNMHSFLSVSKGSDQPPVFLELHYNHAPNTKPLALVGKGICFDSGGISLKPGLNMDKMRADMGGAANVVSAVLTLATLKAPVNVIGLTPLCENMPNGSANKPGDVVTASNGKTIQIDNTDAEGRLILADALHYAHSFEPQAIVDLATLTGAMGVALGSGATGVFSTTPHYWQLLHAAGIETGDRVWRMPLFNHFTKQTTDSQLADCLNIGKIPGQGGACIAAAFLKEFVTHEHWMHLDIAGVMDNRSTEEVAYLCKGMSGRPMRTLVHFLLSVFNKS